MGKTNIMVQEWRWFNEKLSNSNYANGVGSISQRENKSIFYSDFKAPINGFAQFSYEKQTRSKF